MSGERVAVVYHPVQVLHQTRRVDPCEVPARVEGIISEIRTSFPTIPIIEPVVTEHPLVRQIHSNEMIDQLEAASRAAGAEPIFTEFCHDKTGSTPIWEGTYQSALVSVSCAVRAAEMIIDQDASRSYSINRPPGHHAGYDFYHGFSFMNNAVVCARQLSEHRSASVTILDFDFHHGNGTQNLVSHHGGMHYVSTHGDPSFNFPYTGDVVDVGIGVGQNMVANFPYEQGSSKNRLRQVFGQAVDRIGLINPDVLVVSAGFDAHRDDHPPGINSPTEADSSFFEEVGAQIGSLGIPTVVVLEGGYGEHLPSSYTAFFKTLNKYDIK